jgi:hypothetical protein
MTGCTITNVKGVITITGERKKGMTSTTISSNTFSYKTGSTFSAAVKIFNGGKVTMKSNTVTNLKESGTIGYGYFAELTTVEMS